MIEHWLKSFHGDSVEDFVAFFLAIHFVTPFSTQTWSWKNRWSFVKDFVASTPVWRNFNKNLDENSTILFWQKFCGKTRKHFVKTREGIFCLVAKRFATKKRFSFVKDFVASTRAPKKFWRKNLWQNLEAKCFATNTRRKSNEILTKGKWRNQREKSFYQNILQVLRYYGGVQTQYIYIL